MKKTKNVFIYFLFLGFFSSSHGNAQENIWDPGDIFCTHYQRLPAYILEDANRCSDQESTEQIAGDLLKQESEAFFEKTLNPFLRDNMSDPNHAAQNIVWNLRNHSECLDKICFEVYKHCDPGQESTSTAVRSDRWCDHKSYELFEIAQMASTNTMNNNFARKERSLTKQKYNSIKTRFEAYFQYWMPYNVNRLRNFANKVYFFIRNPF